MNGEIIAGSCKARTHKYCTSDAGTTCANTPTDTTYIYYCKFYGNEKQSCEEQEVTCRYCTSYDDKYDNCKTSSSTTHKHCCVFVWYVNTEQCVFSAWGN